MENPPSSGSMAECQLTNWGEWSPCTKTCGRGSSTRTRDYYNPQARQRCLSVMRIPLEETRECIGSDCGGTIPDNGELDGFPEPDVFGETDHGGYMGKTTSWNSKQEHSSLGSGNQAWNRKPYNSWKDKSLSNPRDNAQESPNLPFDQIENPQRPAYNPSDNMGGYDKGFPPTNSYSNDKLVGNRPGYNDFNSDYNNKDAYNEYTTPSFTSRTPFGSRYPNQQETVEGNTNDINGNYNVVQDYCFEKPYASTLPCFAKPVVESNYWFYDHEDHECKIFTTDNCDQNRNRFRTLTACEGTCLQPQINMERSENDAMDLYGRRSYDQKQTRGRPYDQTSGIAYGQTEGRSYDQKVGKSYDRTFGRSYKQTGGGSYDQPEDRSYDLSTGRSYVQPEDRSYDLSRGRSYDQPVGRSYDLAGGRSYGETSEAGDIGEPMSQTRSRYDTSRRGRYGG